MKSQQTQIIVDENGIELLVTFSYEYVLQIEECHGRHDMSYYDIEIESVELAIAGETIDFGKDKGNILPFLKNKQVKTIQEQLEINE